MQIDVIVNNILIINKQRMPFDAMCTFISCYKLSTSAMLALYQTGTILILFPFCIVSHLETLMLPNL